MSKRKDSELLSDILEAARRLMVYTDNMTYEVFISDSKTQDAVIRNLEVIGEAVKNLSIELRMKYPAIPWKSMAGVRDRLIHNYFGVNLDIVWSIVTVELPELVFELKRISEWEGGSR
jgi:uncharacterized protein with HEPN domain